jgi:hypothetical protein
MAALRSMHDDGDATIMEGAVRRSGSVAPAPIFRSRMMDPVPALYDGADRMTGSVPAVYDAADDDGDYASENATAVLEPGTALLMAPAAGVKLAAPVPYRNVGATMVMPAAASIEMRDAIMASLRHVQPPPYPPRAVVALATPPAPVASRSALTRGATRSEILFAACAAVVVGLTAALLFVYLG